jgi:hypothetical protein
MNVYLRELEELVLLSPLRESTMRIKELYSDLQNSATNLEERVQYE